MGNGTLQLFWKAAGLGDGFTWRERASVAGKTAPWPGPVPTSQPDGPVIVAGHGQHQLIEPAPPRYGDLTQPEET